MPMGKIYRYKDSDKSNNVKTLSKKVNKLQKEVLLHKPEMKYYNHFLTGSISPTAPVYYVNDINASTAEDGRIGTSVRTLSILFKCNLFVNSLATSNAVRVVIFMGLQPNGSIPPPVEVIGTTVNLYTTISPRNLDNRHRYLILYDKTFMLNQNGVQAKTIKWYKKCNFISQWSQTSGAIGNCTQHPLFLMFLSDNAVNTPTQACTIQTRYIDN